MNSLSSGLRKIGFISKLNGFNGELILVSDQEDYYDEDFLFIMLEGIPVPFAVEAIFEKGGNIILKFSGIENTAYASRCLKQEVFILDKKPVGRKSSNFNPASLVGFQIVDSIHGNIGPMLRLDALPQQDIAVCQYLGKEILIPLHEDFISKIDESKKEIHLHLPSGLIDIYLNP